MTILQSYEHRIKLDFLLGISTGIYQTVSAFAGHTPVHSQARAPCFRL